MSKLQLHWTFLYNISFSLRTVLYISSQSAGEHLEEAELKTSLSLRLTQLYKETGLQRLPATTHTTVLVTPRTRHSQWLGQYTDKITHRPATSPLPTFIKTGSSYLMWTVHTVQHTVSTMMSVISQKMVISISKFFSMRDLSQWFTWVMWQSAPYVYKKIVFDLRIMNDILSKGNGSEPVIVKWDTLCFQSSLGGRVFK